MLNRREFLQRSAALSPVVLSASALLEACGQAAQQSATGTLTIASTDTPQNLDTQKTVHFPSVEVVTGSLYDVLWEFKKKQIASGQFASDFGVDFEPRLAESWQVAPDGRTWTVKLRQGVKSAAGNEFTSADVKWTWDRISNVKGLGTFYYLTLTMAADDIKVIDKYTVSFTTGHPAATYTCDMQQFAAVIIDSTEAKKHATSDDPWATEWLAKHSAGFGPYVIENWTPGQQMVLRGRDDYYRGAPKIKRVIYRAVPESANRLALLLSGTVDLAEDLSTQELEKVRSSSGVTDLYWPVGSRFNAIMMNLAKKPFDDVRVRQAMAYATPYDDIVSTVYKGRASRMKTIFPSSYPFATGEFNRYTTDYDKARSLLSAARVASGFPLTYSYNSAVPEQEQIGILMRSSLQKVGINLTLDKLPPSVFVQKLQGKEFAFTLFQDQPICPDPGYALFLYYKTNSFVNYANYSNPEVDSLITQGLATLAPDQEKPIWNRVQQLVTQDSPWIFLVEPGFHLGVRSNVKGATWYPINQVQFYDYSKT